MGRSVSFVKGKGSIAHNNREFSTPNVDKERTKDNIIYKQEPLHDAYDKLFGAEIERYNAKQKRSDRKIHNYIDHIRNSKNGEKIFYEYVVQVGTMYNCHVGTKDGETAARILDEYMRDFQERNPNIYVFNAVLHLDEATPHLHIDGIPVAHGYKQGLQIRNSLDKALKEQGIAGTGGKHGNSTQKWQDRERDCLIKIMERHGFEYEAAKDTDRGNLTISQYKAVTEEIEKQVAELPDEINRTPIPLSKDKVIVSAAALDALEEKAKLNQIRDTVIDNIKEYNSGKRSEIDEYYDSKKAEIDQVLQEAKQDRASAFALKQNYARETAAAAAEKNKYHQLFTQQESLNYAYQDLKQENRGLREQNTSLKSENSSLKRQIDDLKAQIVEKVKQAVEPLKNEISTLKEKMERMALGQSTILKAVKFVKERFAAGSEKGVLDGIYKTGGQWLQEDGFKELADPEASLSKSIASNVQMDLVYKVGSEGRGVYSKDGKCIANVASLQDAREKFSSAHISYGEKHRSGPEL